MITSSSINTAKRKHQQDNPSIQFHDAGTDPFSFLARKRKHFPNSLNLVTPKAKKVPVLGTHAAVSQSSSIFNTTNGKVNDLTLDTSYGDVEHLFSDLLHSTSTNPVYYSPSYQAPIVNTSLVPTTESELAFDLNGPMPRHCQFQLDLLKILSHHQTDLKLHDNIITVIKSHSYDQCLNFLSHSLKPRSSYLKDLERNMETSKLRPKDVVVDLTFGGQATVVIFDLETMIMSLLTDPTLMQPKNIAPGYGIFIRRSVGCQDGRYGKIHTGDAWEPAHKHFCGNHHPMNMTIALVIFSDESHLDLHGSLSTLPIIFTLTCFNQESKNKEEFWHPLAFLPNLSYGALTTKNSKKPSNQSYQDEHDCLHAAFLSL